jgi:sugar phosphate isomerase/epimerase
LEAHGVGVSGAHFGYGDYADAGKLDHHIAYAQAMGLKHLMCSGVADGSVDGYRKSAHLFNEIGKRVADLGITFHYHNHDWEFRPLEGDVSGMHVLLQETDPAVVKLNIDVFWLYYAGQDPVGFIAQNADRAGYFHFKDGRRVTGEDGKAHPDFLELGRGDVDLKAAIAAARAANAEWIVAEQDSTRLTPLESLTISRAYMRDALGV